MIPAIDGMETPDEQGWRLVIGLGNPGADYETTRHNVGFDALDLCASRFGLSWKREQNALLVEIPEYRCTLVKPQTYMNRSGVALRQTWLHYELDEATQIFVITDDFHLPLGGLRIRANGSTGGHNGLASIEDQLGCQEYPRLRIGVGDPGRNSVDFVLDTFSAAEKDVIEETLMTSSWVVEDWVKGVPLEDLQARYNRRKPQAGSTEE
ncbi:MAG: aminoacyl-tRNA hydrolase [Planctomycetes bacterium]|nr:aminoacyl-tRNA hydrolase [Planctomycetota bacterium]MCP4771783.1 aminoacyl-tRNA hydrolase [Planctomycetota bacterium]MCP4860974.1 aminoacyl-tRNA hydrolase [Planctomycetota bacterium]